MTNDSESEVLAESDVSPTIGARGKRLWLYPDRQSGPFADVRRRVAIALMAFYLVAPWVVIRGTPLFRLDVFAWKAYFFGLTFQASEASYIAFVLLFFSGTLFLVTTMYGRLWCGYGCPQTVFVDWVIRPIEELIEGDAHHRRRMDKLPMTLAKASRKLAKHALFLLVAALVANTFLAYFVGPDRLLHWMSRSPKEHPFAFGFMLLNLGAFYFDLAWFREQFCSFLCPYARLQSVLMDHQTPAIIYDAKRGDPKGRGAGKGDCIDCGFCERVCPTGIDIRNGLQLECIMCGRCADACDRVMTSLKRPLGLIKKASLDDVVHLKPPRKFYERPRVMIYLGLWLTLVAVIVYVFTFRDPMRVVVTRLPGPPYALLPDGRFSNSFNLRVSNRTSHPLSLAFKVQSPLGAELICPACAQGLPVDGERAVLLMLVFSKDTRSTEAVVSHEETSQSFEVPLIKP